MIHRVTNMSLKYQELNKNSRTNLPMRRAYLRDNNSGICLRQDIDLLIQLAIDELTEMMHTVALAMSGEVESELGLA